MYAHAHHAANLVTGITNYTVRTFIPKKESGLPYTQYAHTTVLSRRIHFLFISQPDSALLTPPASSRVTSATLPAASTAAAAATTTTTTSTLSLAWGTTTGSTSYSRQSSKGRRLGNGFVLIPFSSLYCTRNPPPPYPGGGQGREERQLRRRRQRDIVSQVRSIKKPN